MIGDLVKQCKCMGVYKRGAKKGQSCIYRPLPNNDGFCGFHKKQIVSEVCSS